MHAHNNTVRSESRCAVIKGFVFMVPCIIYEGDSKSKGKIHLTAVIQVTVSNFTYYFST